MIPTKVRSEARSSSSFARTKRLLSSWPSVHRVARSLRFALELAWQLDVVSCSECNRAMRLDEYDLDGFRERLKDANRKG